MVTKVLLYTADVRSAAVTARCSVTENTKVEEEFLEFVVPGATLLQYSKLRDQNPTCLR